MDYEYNFMNAFEYNGSVFSTSAGNNQNIDLGGQFSGNTYKQDVFYGSVNHDLRAINSRAQIPEFYLNNSPPLSNNF